MRKIADCRLGEFSTVVKIVSLDELFSPSGRDVLVVTDSNVAPLLPPDVPFPVLVLEAGEEYKRWDSVEKILSRAVELGYARDCVFIGVGGGVVTDMTAFAASVYMRGVSLVLVPTTLLGMVDAAFGGKTGVDFLSLKNMVGTFYPAGELLIAPAFVASLPERDYIGGLAEVIKHAMLDDERLFELLETERERVMMRDFSVVSELVERALMVKVRIVTEDFREKGKRAFLNLGHTFGHALEAVTGFTRFTHGEAVAWGLRCAMALGLSMGLSPESYVYRVNALLDAYGFLRAVSGVSAEELLEASRMDKKKKGGSVRFVLQRGQGDTLLTEVDDSAFIEAVSAFLV
ncbi:3-dehydroquinate synthase family protein [Spirochaetia bacterium 38H-sp]|uniref:3-dehydroquinate synthase family protein n=1 Tax=Rarispira pelagica TaxID=3141764 RepID=A0ABU9UC39_9SPIR